VRCFDRAHEDRRVNETSGHQEAYAMSLSMGEEMSSGGLRRNWEGLGRFNIIGDKTRRIGPACGMGGSFNDHDFRGTSVVSPPQWYHPPRESTLLGYHYRRSREGLPSGQS
jgi:hypothetical protein